MIDVLCAPCAAEWYILGVSTLGNIAESYGRHYAEIGTTSLYKL